MPQQGAALSSDRSDARFMTTRLQGSCVAHRLTVGHHG